MCCSSHSTKILLRAVAYHAWGVAVLAFMSGCHATGFPDLTHFAHSTVDEQEAAETDDSLAQLELDEVARQLQADTWFTTVASADEMNRTPSESYRWQHAGLDQLLRRSSADGQDWLKLLNHADRVVAVNAAIALARQDQADGVDRLMRAVRDVEAKMPLRLAAAEALGAHKSEVLQTAASTLLGEFGAFEKSTRGYVPELHAELVTSLARHVDAGADPHFAQALRSPAPEVRSAALRAWSQSRAGALPEIVSDLLYDPNARVRIEALNALVARQPEMAQEFVTRTLHDHELSVRLAAVAALGKLGSPQAIVELRTLLEDRAELIRSAAVSALADAGELAVAQEAVDDASWRVRETLARQLATQVDGSADGTVRRLLEDASPQVQQQTIAALAHWPIERAAPLLLAAVESASYVARRDSIAILAQHVPSARDFPVDAPAERRREAFAVLEQACLIQLGSLGRIHSALTASLRRSTAVSSEQLEQAALWVETLRMPRRIARQKCSINSLNEAALVPTLAVLVVDRNVVLPELLYRDLLPRHDPEFELLRQLQSTDRDQRRRTAYQLMARRDEDNLSDLALQRLVELMLHEPDEVVWRSVFETLAADPRKAVAELAYAGLSHPADDVRVRACDHLSHYPAAEHASRLVPSLADDNRLVVLAAARALGAGPPAAADPLVQLLATRDRELHLEVARTLVRWGDDRGRDALERLAYDADIKVKQRAIELMGEFPDQAHLGTLIAQLDASPSLRRAALQGLQRTVKEDHGQSSEGQPLNAPEQAARWKAWWQQQLAAGLVEPTGHGLR